MKKILLISLASILTSGLVGCHTMNNAVNSTENFANATIGTGVKYTATAVGTGLGVVGNAGAAVGRGAGAVVNTGANIVTGHPRNR